jgi:uncharacterized protein
MPDRADVVVVSGHMVDAPDRPVPRFPATEVARVTDEIVGALDRWSVGEQTTVVSGGARGADIIVAEQARLRGAQIVLCLAVPPDEFVERSVALPDSDWAERFSVLLADAEVRVLGDERGDVASGDDVFAQTNAWIIDVARAVGEQPPHAVIVWDGHEGDGPGGTRDFVRRLGHHGPDPRIAVIDPVPRAYRSRETAEGSKRLLALDGGGIRGVLSLRILQELETQLRDRYGHGFVLGDFFDYVAGTSTGAIIATGLALGMPVQALQNAYRELAEKVFSKRFLPMRLRSLYRDGPLTEQLETILGRHRTLGDPELRSLLLIVLHNTVTDSPWPLSNCTRAKYNAVERCLLDPPDRNLDLPLTTVVRGSTAAPMYFPPQHLRIGAHDFVFQDGGITPFSNPAMLLFLVATLPEYGLQWPTGAERMLVVSVGTGRSAATHPGLQRRSVHALFNARNVPSVFMNGASVVQDMLCRSFGQARAGMAIDREFGDRVCATDGVAESALFSYVRYDADLTDEGLAAHGVTDRRRRARLRKLDGVGAVDDLETLGTGVADTVDAERDLAGFLE